jgi:predicted nucleic acid-binding protein
MASPALDSNILIDYLLGRPEAAAEVERSDRPAVISIISWIEVMSGAGPDDEAQVRDFLDGFDIVPVTPTIAIEAARLRRARRLKLPDAIIWATARVGGRILVTRNTKDFPVDDPGVREPYRL